MLSVFTIDNTFIISYGFSRLGIWEQLGLMVPGQGFSAVCHTLFSSGAAWSASRTTHSHSSWREASVPQHTAFIMLFFMEVLEVPLQCASCLTERVIRERQGRTHDDFCDLASEVTLHHVCNILLVKPKSCVFSVRLEWGGLRQGPEYQKRWGSLGTIMGSVTRVYL